MMSAMASGILALPVLGRLLPEETVMAWKAPKIVEISLALEINSYACAEID